MATLSNPHRLRVVAALAGRRNYVSRPARELDISRALLQVHLSGHEAIVGGVAVSAGVVTSAAAIMVGVFSVFTTLSAIEYKMLGTGMAVAILIDATVVRGVLLPAALALLGERAWTLPGRGGFPARTRPDDPHAYVSSTTRA
ncbi:MMPL family transporter [Streptomyces niveus]|uniref:ArsR/SmtB family transcription factor n=1 Tax=Streptomyces niveus TaxID=193462 RepID=UPI003F4DA6B6